MMLASYLFLSGRLSSAENIGDYYYYYYLAILIVGGRYVIYQPDNGWAIDALVLLRAGLLVCVKADDHG